MGHLSVSMMWFQKKSSGFRTTKTFHQSAPAAWAAAARRVAGVARPCAVHRYIFIIATPQRRLLDGTTSLRVVPRQNRLRPLGKTKYLVVYGDLGSFFCGVIIVKPWHFFSRLSGRDASQYLVWTCSCSRSRGWFGADWWSFISVKIAKNTTVA